MSESIAFSSQDEYRAALKRALKHAKAADKAAEAEWEAALDAAWRDTQTEIKRVARMSLPKLKKALAAPGETPSRYGGPWNPYAAFRALPSRPHPSATALKRALKILEVTNQQRFTVGPNHSVYDALLAAVVVS